MLGKLNSQSASILDNSAYTMAVFGTHLHIFHRSSQICQAEIQLGHDSHIVAVSVGQNNGNVYTVSTVEQNGLLIVTEITIPTKGYPHKTISYKTVKKQQILQKSTQNNRITSAIITLHTIFIITSSSTLHTYNISSNTLSNPCPSIKFSAVLSANNNNDKYVYVRDHDHDQKIIHVFSTQTAECVNKYINNCAITAVIQVQDNLVIGDEKGKITIVYEYFKQPVIQQSKSNKNKRNIDNTANSSLYTAVLEWHTGPIHALASNGNYLYSGGQQSVIVVWHIRDLSRDFMPRVGASITSLSVCSFSNQILCTLSDNSFILIDLSNDKEVFSYRTIVDPWGYAPLGTSRFSQSTTACNEGVICLKGLPGRLQFIDTTKNGFNWELQVVGRNLINSINGDQLQPHRITGFAFSSNWNTLMVSIQGINQSYLKFYKRTPSGYQLSTRIDSPHNSNISASCMSMSTGTSARFVTWSQGDTVVRVWVQHSQKKKSIMDVTQNYWRCQQEISYRGLTVSAVTVYGSLLVVVFASAYIIVYQAQDNDEIKQISHFLGTDIKQAIIISNQSHKGNNTYKILLKTSESLQIHSFQLNTLEPSSKKSKQSKSNSTLIQKLKLLITASSFIITGSNQLAILVQNQEKSSTQVIILDRKSAKFIDSYQCDSIIETGFYLSNLGQSRLILVDNNMKLCSIDGNSIIKYSESLEQDNQTQWASQIEAQSDSTDIYKLNARWVMRESIKKNCKVQDAVQGMECMPGGQAAWMQIASRLIL